MELKVLRDPGPDHLEEAAVVIEENIQVSVLMSLILKDLGLSLVIPRANSPLHAGAIERGGVAHAIQR